MEVYRNRGTVRARRDRAEVEWIVVVENLIGSISGIIGNIEIANGADRQAYSASQAAENGSWTLSSGRGRNNFGQIARSRCPEHRGCLPDRIPCQWDNRVGSQENSKVPRPGGKVNRRLGRWKRVLIDFIVMCIWQSRRRRLSPPRAQQAAKWRSEIGSISSPPAHAPRRSRVASHRRYTDCSRNRRPARWEFPSQGR